MSLTCLKALHHFSMPTDEVQNICSHQPLSKKFSPEISVAWPLHTTPRSHQELPVASLTLHALSHLRDGACSPGWPFLPLSVSYLLLILEDAAQTSLSAWSFLYSYGRQSVSPSSRSLWCFGSGLRDWTVIIYPSGFPLTNAGTVSYSSCGHGT